MYPADLVQYVDAILHLACLPWPPLTITFSANMFSQIWFAVMGNISGQASGEIDEQQQQQQHNAEE